MIVSNKKGLTLVEIIVAIALLGIIGVFLFPALTNQYILLRGSRFMTEDLYTAQQEIERVITDIKKDIQTGTTPDGQIKTSYTLFSGQSIERSVDGYPNDIFVHVGNNAITLSTVVADNRMPAFDVAVASNVRLRFHDGSAYLPNAYVDTPSLRLLTSFDLADPSNVNLTNISRWYVSRAGFNSPMIISPTEIENGTVYPRFPEDYTIIPNVSSTNLNDIRREFAGKHIIYTITPASQSGKMGTTVPSNPVFISGLPHIDNLVLHLDASSLSREDSNVVEVGGRYFVARWNDLSQEGNNATQSTSNRQPELLDIKTGHVVINNTTYETYAKFLRFNGNQGLSILDDNSLDTTELTVFSVIRANPSQAGKTLLAKINSTTGWNLGWTGSNQLGFTIRNSGGINTINANPDAALDGEWHIITSTSDLSFQVDSESPLTQARTVSSAITNSSPLVIGYNGSTNYSTVDIAEIIIFRGVLSTQDQYDINMYLKNKYLPELQEVNIYALKPITGSAVIGEPYTLPNTITAYMTNGTLMDVAVTWSQNPIDTSVAGTHTSVASAVSNPSKTTTARIEVSGIFELPDQHVTVMQNAAYALPDQVIAVLSTGKTHLVDVDWDEESVDTQNIGTVIRTATAKLDPAHTMTLTISIVPQSVTGVTLNVANYTLDIDSTVQLVASVLPSNAYNKEVSWSTSDPDIAIVSDSGIVTAVHGGNAIITVTTVDGGFTASCSIIVTKSVTGVTLDRDRIVVRQGTVFNLTASVLPGDATNQAVSWESSNRNVATVNSNGRVTAVRNGEAIITVTTDDGGYTAQCRVTVGNPVTGVDLSPSSTTISRGSSRSMSLTVYPWNASVTDVIWTSSNESVATVDNSGRVTGVGAGTATISVETVDGGFTDSSTITVVVPVTGVTLNVNNLTLPKGESFTLVASVIPADASNTGVSWFTSSSSRVSVNQSGVITASSTASNGSTATITVRTNDGNYSATCLVTIGSPVTGITLNRMNLTLTQNDSFNLVASISPDDAANESVTWSSSDAGIVSVNSSGRLTAVSGGTAIITATTVDGGYTAQCLVTVPLYATGISGNNTTIYLTMNKPIQSASLSGSSCSASGNIVTCTGSYSSGYYDINVVATDGESKNVTVERYRTFWGSWRWIIVNP